MEVSELVERNRAGGVPRGDIVVVDDDPGICEYMQILLAKEGCTARAFVDPEHALADIAARPCNVAMLDLMLPKISGVELIERIRALQPNLPIIAFSGYYAADTAVRAIAPIATDYLQKPFEHDELRAILDRHLPPREPPPLREDAVVRQIGRTIRERRLALDLTLKTLATRSQLSVSLISQIERAESSPSIASLCRIAQSLEMPLAALFAGC